MGQGFKNLFSLGFATVVGISFHFTYLSSGDRVYANSSPTVKENTNQKINAYRLYQKAERLFFEGIELYEIDKDKNKEQFKQALKLWQESLSLYEELEDTRGQIACLKSLATTYNFLEQHELVVNQLDRLVFVYNKVGNLKAVADTKVDLAEALFSLQKHDRTMATLQEASQIYRRLEKQQKLLLMANTLSYKGLFLSAQAEPNRARKYFEQSLKIAQQLEEKKIIAENLNHLGSISLKLAENEKAKSYFQSSLEIAQQIENNEIIANNYYNLGLTYLKLEKIAEAKEYLDRSLALAIKIKEKELIARDLSDLGAIYFNLKDYEKAQKYLEKSLILAQELGKKELVARNLSSLATNVYLQMEEYEKVEEYLEQSLALARELGKKELVADNFSALGNMYLKLGKYQEAKTYLQQSISLYQELGSETDLKFNAELLDNLEKSQYVSLFRLGSIFLGIGMLIGTISLSLNKQFLDRERQRKY